MWILICSFLSAQAVQWGTIYSDRKTYAVMLEQFMLLWIICFVVDLIVVGSTLIMLNLLFWWRIDFLERRNKNYDDNWNMATNYFTTLDTYGIHILSILSEGSGCPPQNINNGWFIVSIVASWYFVQTVIIVGVDAWVLLKEFIAQLWRSYWSYSHHSVWFILLERMVMEKWFGIYF